MANCKKCGRKLPGFSFSDGECKWCKDYAAAQRGETPEDARQEVMPTPWERSGSSSSMLVTQAFAGICGAVFIGMIASGASLTDPSGQELIRWGANYAPWTMGGEWWRLVTSVFVHIGIIHIALNMWCLWSLGQMAEPMYGRGTFAVIYLACGVAGSLASALVHPQGLSAGASGAIFGIAGALIASFKLGEFAMPRAAVQASLKSVVTFAGYNLLFGMVSGRVDNAAHVGGLVMGLLLGAMMAKLAPDKEDAGRRIFVLGVVVLVMAGGVGWQQHSNGYKVHLRRASALMEDNKVDEAIVEYEQAVRMKPEDGQIRNLLAWAVLAKGDTHRAAVELQKAIQADPKNAYAVYTLGTVYQTQKEFDKAKGEYLKAGQINPKIGYPHVGLASVASEQGDDELAVREYRRALELDPELESANYMLGESLRKLKRWDEAIAAFEKEIELSGDPNAASALGSVYEAKGMKKEAEEARGRAEKLKTK
jgi:rhomboid protease GluP